MRESFKDFKLKLLIFDLDQTLLTKDKIISPLTYNILKEFQNNEIYLGINTARNYFGSKRIIDLLNPEVVITSCGALITYKDKDIYESYFTSEETKYILDIIREILIDEGILTVATRNSFYMQGLSIDETIEAWEASIIKDLSDFEEESLMIQFKCENKDKADIISKKLNKYEISKYSASPWYRISNINNSKGNALNILEELTEIKKENIMAFGDDITDLDMLKNVKYGIAMDNSIKEIKDVADIIIGNNDEEAIYYFLNEYKNELLKR